MLETKRRGDNEVEFVLSLHTNLSGIMIAIALKLILGLIAIFIGANYLVDSSVAIAKRFRISDMVIGMTLVALGTSAPEIVVSYIGAFDGSSEIAIGNVIGSNVCNMLLVLGLATIVFPLPIAPRNRKAEIPCVLLATVLVLLLDQHFCKDFWLGKGAVNNYYLNRFGGLVLILYGVAFLVYSYLITKREQARSNYQYNPEEEKKSVPQLFRKIYDKKSLIPVASLVFVLSCVLLVIGGNYFVDGAKEFAKLIGMKEMTIAATVVAVATSLPELATSVVAAFKKNSGIALGNIVGSNVLNICLALGGSALIIPLKTSIEAAQLGFFVLSPLLLFIFALIAKKKFHRIFGVIFILLYITYIWCLLTG